MLESGNPVVTLAKSLLTPSKMLDSGRPVGRGNPVDSPAKSLLSPVRILDKGKEGSAIVGRPVGMLKGTVGNAESTGAKELPPTM